MQNILLLYQNSLHVYIYKHVNKNLECKSECKILIKETPKKRNICFSRLQESSARYLLVLLESWGQSLHRSKLGTNVRILYTRINEIRHR